MAKVAGGGGGGGGVGQKPPCTPVSAAYVLLGDGADGEVSFYCF